jgi:erythronate-4-phosphate dehydrogenase
VRILVDSKLPFVEELFGHFGAVVVLDTQAITNKSVHDADALVIRSETRVDGSLLEGSRVRFVGTATIGTDHVDTEYLRARGISFANAPGSNANSVAEYLVAALLELEERLGFRLKGGTLGVVGVGNTGRRVAKMAEGLGMQLLLNDPPLARETGDTRYRPLDELMSADILTLHVPLTREGVDKTFHLFDEARLSRMKPGSILINTSRGGVVNTAALKNSLKEQRLSACVLDVWEDEPMIDPELLSLATIGTPHIAGYSFDGKVNAATMIARELARFLGADAKSVQSVGDHSMRSIAPAAGNTEDTLRSVVREVYNITLDDRTLRRMLTLPSADHGVYFRSLRAHYPKRIEFSHFSVLLTRHDETLERAFTALGFRLARR